MARTGRPKAEKPFDHKVTVKFKEEGTTLSAKFGNDSRGNEIVNGSYVNDKNVSINLSVDKSNDNILGYEIYRNGKPAGFIERNKNGQETAYCI